MGLSGVGFSELLLLFVIVVLLFGTKKLSNLGADLGSAIRGFRQAMNEGSQTAANNDNHATNANLSHLSATTVHSSETEKKESTPRS